MGEGGVGLGVGKGLEENVGGKKGAGRECKLGLLLVIYNGFTCNSSLAWFIVC